MKLVFKSFNLSTLHSVIYHAASASFSHLNNCSASCLARSVLFSLLASGKSFISLRYTSICLHIGRCELKIVTGFSIHHLINSISVIRVFHSLLKTIHGNFEFNTSLISGNIVSTNSLLLVLGIESNNFINHALISVISSSDFAFLDNQISDVTKFELSILSFALLAHSNTFFAHCLVISFHLNNCSLKIDCCSDILLVISSVLIHKLSNLVITFTSFHDF
ncbi:MAG: hypothetical protein U9Q66_04345, partial [Patescibacteria group bacterium]|nr:hypothetical protein [Patescibacteria group bacterium]